MNTIFATKKNMSQVFTREGVRLPVTVLSSGSHLVTQAKAKDRDGYWATQFGFGTRKIKNLNKPQIENFKKTGALKENRAPKFLREVRHTGEENLEVGAKINPSEVLEPGDLVKVSATSKGKGFAGGVKRHHFAGGPKTHGQSDRHRAPGSIGQGTTPGRVYKGKRMAGRMGGEQQSVRNLRVLSISSETGEILVSGPVPGSVGSLVTITKIGKSKKNIELIGQAQSEQVSEETGETEGQTQKVETKKGENEPTGEVLSELDESKDGSQTE
ncbi:MAG: 50S ribosomal protein L3 [Candidatus Blackburnbacteria bacterium]|nr:50S ribosomal protein L3 [Candidatus Blackburnbacteria bacterium]